LFALDSGDTVLRAGRALVNGHASNIGDPWPTVVAAGVLVHSPGAPLYRGFQDVGSSFIYPPFAALLYSPIGGLGYDAAHAALSVVSRVAFVLCLVLGALVLRVRTIRSAALLAIAGLGFYPLLRAVELNQATLLVSLAVGGALVLAQRDQFFASGLCIAIAASLKPQLALMLPLLAWHAPRLVAGGLVGLILTTLASLAVTGIQNHVEYVRDVLPRVSAGYAFYPNQSFGGAFSRLAGLPFRDFALTSPGTAVRVASTLAAVGVFAFGIWTVATARGASSPFRSFERLYRDRPERSVVPTVLAFAWLIATLTSPIAWEHHFAPAFFLFALILKENESWRRWAIMTAAAAFPFIAGYVEVRTFTSLPGRLATSYTLVAAIALALAVGSSLRGRPDDGARQAPAI
jgi:alpha-1,2-mannosyltransferase